MFKLYIINKTLDRAKHCYSIEKLNPKVPIVGIKVEKVENNTITPGLLRGNIYYMQSEY